MTKFQVGDKVKFLNAIGGGVVVRIQNGQVFVQDDTGFDMPMAPNELIRMADMTGAGKVFNQDLNVDVADIEEIKRLAAAESKSKALQEEQNRRLREKFTGNSDEQSMDQLSDENRRLRSQVASLKDQVSRLQVQLSRLQSLNAKNLNNNILLQYLVAPGHAEVDLHIEALHDNPSQLSDSEKHNLQLRFFRTCLNHAILNGMKKVTFIHGVGRGVLKTEIQNELDQYDGVSYMDAPISKYGVGATEVYFKTKQSL
ncbi:MAG: Smr/MutS family protein [Bacteroidales bacterium]|nr:Smr/MutS family protein [Bacteroidales bacterium]